jgi:hypothetical protein
VSTNRSELRPSFTKTFQVVRLHVFP